MKSSDLSQSVKIITNMPARASIHRVKIDQQMNVRELSLDLRATNPLNGSHGHWTQVAAHRAEQRVRTTSELLAACAPRHPVLVTLTRRAPSLCDDDGLTATLKGVRDAIATAYGLDDNDITNIFFAYRQEQCSKWSVGVKIETTAQPKLEWHKREVERLMNHGN